MKRKLVLFIVLATAAVSLASGGSGPNTAFELRTATADGCPVQILDRKSRVLDSLQRHPSEYLTGKPEPDRRAYGLGESQFVYEVGFRNLAGSDLTFVEFLWTAHDESGKVLFARRSRHEEPLGAGMARRDHDVDIKPSDRVKWFDLQVSRAVLADGTEWKAPEVPQADRAAR